MAGEQMEHVELKHWFKAHEIGEAPSCPFKMNSMKNGLSYLEGPLLCNSSEVGYATFHGKYDKNMLPKGPGYFESSFITMLLNYTIVGLKKANHDGQMSQKFCFNLDSEVDQIHGKFAKGLPNGKAKVIYNRDGASLEVEHMKKGVINGLVKQFDGENKLQMIGNYENGVPHGPFWIIFPSQYIFIHFQKAQWFLSIIFKNSCIYLF